MIVHDQGGFVRGLLVLHRLAPTIAGLQQPLAIDKEQLGLAPLLGLHRGVRHHPLLGNEQRKVDHLLEDAVAHLQVRGGLGCLAVGLGLGAALALKGDLVLGLLALLDAQLGVACEHFLVVLLALRGVLLLPNQPVLLDNLLVHPGLRQPSAELALLCRLLEELLRQQLLPPLELHRRLRVLLLQHRLAPTPLALLAGVDLLGLLLLDLAQVLARLLLHRLAVRQHRLERRQVERRRLLGVDHRHEVALTRRVCADARERLLKFIDARHHLVVGLGVAGADLAGLLLLHRELVAQLRRLHLLLPLLVPRVLDAALLLPVRQEVVVAAQALEGGLAHALAVVDGVRHGGHRAVRRLLVLPQHLLLEALAHHRRHDVVRVLGELAQPLLEDVVHLRVVLVLLGRVGLQRGQGVAADLDRLGRRVVPEHVALEPAHRHHDLVQQLLRRAGLPDHDVAGGARVELDAERAQRGLQQHEVVGLRVRVVPVDEQVEVRLHLVLVQQLAERVAIGEVGLEVGDGVAQVHLVVEPAQQDLRHAGRGARARPPSACPRVSLLPSTPPCRGSSGCRSRRKKPGRGAFGQTVSSGS